MMLYWDFCIAECLLPALAVRGRASWSQFESAFLGLSGDGIIGL